MEAAGKAQKQVDELRARADKLQKEAEVAAEIAREKSEASQKAGKGLKVAEVQVHNLQAQELVTKKFLQQTEKEEKVLEQKVASLQQMRIKVTKAAIPVQKAASNSSNSSTRTPAGSKPNASSAAAGSGNASSASAVNASAVNATGANLASSGANASTKTNLRAIPATRAEKRAVLAVTETRDSASMGEAMRKL